jgi:hypothetical protein
MKYAIKMMLSGMIYVPSFIKIGTGVEAILRYNIRNLRGCNASIDAGRD